jgi:hypothetical protein
MTPTLIVGVDAAENERRTRALASVLVVTPSRRRGAQTLMSRIVMLRGLLMGTLLTAKGWYRMPGISCEFSKKNRAASSGSRGVQKLLAYRT